MCPVTVAAKPGASAAQAAPRPPPDPARAPNPPLLRLPRRLAARLALAVLGFAGLLGQAAAPGEPSPPGDAPPLANLAGYGRVSVVDQADAAARTDAASLAVPGGAPVALVPGNALQIEWTQPRPVREVALTFAPPLPKPEEVRIQWWRRIWPDNGRGGWMKLDDPFNGHWTRVSCSVRSNLPAFAFGFAPLGAEEARGVKQTGEDYRLTYKLRVFSPSLLRLSHVGVFSDAQLRRARLRFEWDLKTRVPGKWAPRFEVRNGRVLRTESAGRNSAFVDLEYADTANPHSADRGKVLCRSGEWRSFAVFVDDVLREKGIYVRDIGAFVSDAAAGLKHASWTGPSGEVWSEGTVAEQVARLPEQSFAQVSQAIPTKPSQYLFLGVPHVRQEIALLPQGDIQLFADSLRSPGPDAEMRPWTWDSLVFQFGVGDRPVMGPQADRQVARRLERGWLPVVTHDWRQDDIRWTESSTAVPLGTPLAAQASTTGTEPVVLATRFEFTNSAAAPRVATLWMELSHPVPATLGWDGTLVLRQPSRGPDRPGLVPVRAHFNTGGKGALDLAVLTPGGPGSYNPALQNSAAAREAVRYRLELAPGEGHAIELAVPYVESLNAAEMAALKTLSFAQARREVVEFWEARVAQGMTYEVPELYLNEFFKANLWRVLISTDLDPLTGQYQHGAATHRYKNFLNETAMVVRSLEMRGEHQEAQQLLETFLANQGAKGLPGNFRSSLGVLYAAHPAEPDPYTAQGYNLHHGWGLWAAAEHARWTSDRDWLARWAPQLILGAQWIARERQATQTRNPDGSRPVEYGLLPAGDLEDVEEYLYWYATDAYHYLGLKRVAEVLRECAEPTPAHRRRAGSLPAIPAALAREAESFLADIRASVAESVATTPVVRLRDGTWVPYVPPRAEALTHREEGWIREALYPALHLVNGEVYDERHPYVDWMVQELEDNIFLSEESGFGVKNPREDFFSLGGITLQPNLLDLALVYLQRDQVPNFLRAFYNTAWASLYPDVVCFAEWVPAYGQGGGPLYKTPDECKFIQWMRQMLVLERGDALELGLGVPRAWMQDGQRVRIERAATWFGKLDLEIRSRAGAGSVEASVRLAPGREPRAVRLRLRHPDGNPIRSATVNGRTARVEAHRQTVELPTGTSAWAVEARF